MPAIQAAIAFNFVSQKLFIDGTYLRIILFPGDAKIMFCGEFMYLNKPRGFGMGFADCSRGSDQT
jgi:hypothetical protein